MKTRFIYFLIGLFIFIGITFAINYFGKNQHPNVSDLTNDGAQLSALSDFHVRDIHGNPLAFSLPDTKVIVINFWATWCPPCQAEIPHLIKAHGTYAEKGVRIIGISLDDYQADAQAFAVQHRIPYSIAMGNRELTAIFGGISSIPTTFILDANYRVLDMILGYTSMETLERKLTAYL
ncbi:MAG: TlpA disulfide reductase family protein [bacterium]|nr:TlpA disulfide reductase family protein [bacterium]